MRGLVAIALVFIGCGDVETTSGPAGAAGAERGGADGTAGASGTTGAGGAAGAACPVGAEGCACYGNDTCDVPLRCASHLCVSLGGAGGGAGTIGSAGGAGTGNSTGTGNTTGQGGRGGSVGTGNSTGTGNTTGAGGSAGGSMGTGGTGGASCPNGCPYGSTCVAGACACPPTCPSGSTCVAGAPGAFGGSACMCNSAAQTVCPLAGTLYCIDTRTSTANCGGCGHVCELPAGTCSGGACVAN